MTRPLLRTCHSDATARNLLLACARITASKQQIPCGVPLRNDTNSAEGRSQTLIVVVLLIAPFSIPHRESKSERHDPQRWYQHYQDRSIDRPLTLFRRRLCIGSAHRATLR